MSQPGSAFNSPVGAIDIALRSGRAVRIRPVGPDDMPALRAFLARLRPEDRALRFSTGAVDLDRAARDAADVAYPDRIGFVALGEDEHSVLAHAYAIRTAADEAEVAFAVDEQLRGEGVATAMLAHLAAAAHQAGIERFTAVVLPWNTAMLDVFRDSGLATTATARSGEVHVTIATELGQEGQGRYDQRDAEAAAAAVARVLRPSSIAVVGASDRDGSVGGAVLRNILRAGFTGSVHAINRRGGTVAGQPALCSIGELGEPVDLVVIAIPAAGVLDVARGCADRGVRALVVLSDGFGEAGVADRRRQHELVSLCRRAGMRLVGPNCLGVLNTDPQVRLDATFAPNQPPRGRIAFLSQSGALGIAVIDTARELGIGLSSFASVGNKADLSGNDFLCFWERDPATDVVLLYLESFGNPRKFSRIARRVARRKPIVAVKGGRSVAGAHAAGSHTGALLAASDATVHALFEQAGVIATDTLGGLFDVGSLLAAQPAPRGMRVGIVSNGGGLGILCADACVAAGLDVVTLAEPLRRSLREGTGPGASLQNPIDLLAAASPAHFEHAIRCLSSSGAVDAVIALYVPPMISDPEAVAGAIHRAAGTVPVAAVMAMADPPLAALADEASTVPAFRFPEDAARALARAARYGLWLTQDEEPAPFVDADVLGAASVLAGALAREAGWLAPAEVAALLDAYTIVRPAQRTVTTIAAATRVAREFGGPVALKAVADGLVHRTDVGAVTTGLASPTAVGRELRAMRQRVTEAGFAVSGFVVQAMAPPGVEMLAGVVVDPTFGPVIAVGAGGTAAEVLGDSAIRLAPITTRTAHEMIRSLRSFPLLDGFRGAPRCDVSALEDLLLRLAVLADTHPEVAEIECNPVSVGPAGALAVDARVRVAPPQPRLPDPALPPA